MVIVLEELADMKRKYEKALSRITEPENVLRHSLTRQPSIYYITRASGAPKAVLPAPILIATTLISKRHAQIRSARRQK